MTLFKINALLINRLHIVYKLIVIMVVCVNLCIAHAVGSTNLNDAVYYKLFAFESVAWFCNHDDAFMQPV